MSRRALHTASGGAIYRHRYIAPPEAVCSAPTDMYRPGPIHNTGRYLAGFALHTGTAIYRAQTRYTGGATFLTRAWREASHPSSQVGCEGACSAARLGRAAQRQICLFHHGKQRRCLAQWKEQLVRRRPCRRPWPAQWRRSVDRLAQSRQPSPGPQAGARAASQRCWWQKRCLAQSSPRKRANFVPLG